MRRLLLAVLLTASLACGADPVAAGTKSPHGKIIAGYVERITLLPWNEVVKAKLDTGAATSSIHARKIERFKKDGKSWVRFEAVLETADGIKTYPVERPLARRVLIKSARDDNDPRLAVDLEFCFNGQRQHAQFTLADRDDLLYPVLLGRAFLRGIAVVDPETTFATKIACDVPPPPASPEKKP